MYKPTYVHGLADLQYAYGELCCRLCCQPEPEVWVGLGQLLEGLLQLFEPADEEVAVLQHEPVASLGRGLQELESNLGGEIGRASCRERV